MASRILSQTPRIINGKRLLLGTAGLTGTYIAYRSFQPVQPGHVGFTNLFGNVSNKAKLSGYHVINPLAKMEQLDLRDKNYTRQTRVASKEGLSIDVDVAVITNLDQRHARDIFVNVGPKYQNVLLIPQLESVIRDTVAGYDAKALYTNASREEIRRTINDRLKAKTEHRGILIKDVLINRITLPHQLTASIERKLEAEQEMEKMNFIVQREQKEADRKKIEAEGIKNFQDIVADGVSEPLLRWKGITATEELAKSPNTKIVIVGGKDGLPLILNSER